MNWKWALGILLIALLPLAAQAGFTREASAYMDQARQALLQRAPGNPPFHIKANFEMVLPKTHSPESGFAKGSYEETWISRDEWRRDFEIDGVRYTIARYHEEIWKLPADMTLPEGALLMSSCVVPAIPLSSDEAGDKPAKWNLQHVKLGGMQLDRIGDPEQAPEFGRRRTPDFGYYFLAGQHVLLMRATGPGGIQFDKSSQLDGKLVLTAGTWTRSADETIHFSLNLVEAAQANSDIFNPPPEAKRFPAGSDDGTIHDMQRLVIGEGEYPRIAMSAHISGSVLVTATISSDGTPTNVKALSGPPTLKQAAVNAVSRSKYTPATIDGVAVSQSIQVIVNFRLGASTSADYGADSSK